MNPFAVDLTALPDDNYRISVNARSAEDIRVEVKSPFGQQEIRDTLAILSHRKPDVLRMEETRTARQFGQKLFKFLVGEHSHIHAAYAASLKQGSTRIQLSLEYAGTLGQLPWELLRDPNRDFLALADSTPIVRSTSYLNIRPPIPLLMPLRVLVVVANHPLADEEWQRLQVASAEMRGSEQLRLDRSDRPTLTVLRRRLLAEDYHVVHMIVPGAMDKQTEESFLLIEGREQIRLTSNDLSAELHPESTVRLVTLTSYQPYKTALVNFAGNLKVPGALTTQFQMSGTGTSLFYSDVYRALIEGYPLDLAVSRTRRTLANRFANHDWAAPVAYIRSDDARLFRPLSSKTASG